MKELKAPGKITQKMTRDGLTEENQTTGETAPITAREPDTPLAKPPETAGRVIGRVESERVNLVKKRMVKQANTKIREPGKPSRLQFTTEERADPALDRFIRKSDKAVDKLDAAQAKIPKKHGLRFADGKPRVNPLNRPVRETGLYVHSKIHSAEDDNSGVEGAHSAEQFAADTYGRISRHNKKSKLKPYRASAKAEQAAAKADVNTLYHKAIRDNPDLENANAVKKVMQKQKIKREYAKAARQGTTQAAQKTAATAKKTAEKATEAAQKTAAFVRDHWKAIGIALAIVGIIALLFAGISSCGSMLTGGFNSIIGTSYTAEDSDITGVDGDYTALETALRQRINRIESDYPGYDEYRYNLDEIGHDPFELASYLTTLLNNYTPSQAGAELAALFGRQYTLTLTPVTETRYRTETRTGTSTYTDADGNTQTEEYEYTVQVPYSYYILNVSLVNHSLETAAVSGLSVEQKEMYDIYMETRGNKPYLFEGNIYVGRGEYTDYDVPPEALTDTRFAAMIQEAEKYLGYPYVWGGSSPSTSFDCSGFVSWVINHSVGSVGRQTATGLFNGCAIIPKSEAKPGDLIFFTGTYDSPGPVSHVGIYVGNDMMIHCGNPISYANITSNYWTQHFYAIGRLP
ncbi:conjugal transfer protein [Clostridia bacterium]|nr:conjugal transfer protein [Clostridia bacterium]